VKRTVPADPRAEPTVHDGPGGLPFVTLVADDGARAVVCLQGAHVTSWVPAGEEGDRLFLSGRAEFRAGTAIRGGVPVSFPQFAAQGPLPKHGFARVTPWELVSAGRSGAEATATFRLTDSAETRAIWPHRFAAELTVRVGGPALSIEFTVANIDQAPFSFTAALHTYLRVDDVRRAAVTGLQGTRYRDKAAGETEPEDRERELRVDGEVDRVYLNAPRAVEVWEDGRRLKVQSTGFADVVVWNPGPEAAAKLTDMEPEGHLRMLCVEAAAAGSPIYLAPGGRWTGSQTLIAR
jgi:glucose-6-phosphate 1-epimerase